ncbi:MAG: hypothetical protein OXU20_02360 [Myxococcales bacterium]|nr:hypothetical protein [Myxococcales bacterium]
MLHELLVASGYTRLKDDIAPSAIWLRAPWPNTLTHEAVYVARDQRALGHVTVTRAYSKTWLGHEIATLRNHPEAMACRRTLYQHFSVWPRLLDGDDAHLLGYYDRTRPWHQRMFEGFADRCGDQDCLVLPMERYALDRPSDASEDDQQGGLSAGASVARAGISDAEWVAELVGKHWPGLVLRAFDIHPDRLTAECMHPAYRTAHLRRARDVLVLRVREQPVGAALCEWSDSRISLFNVLNMAQIFIESDADVPAEARNLLVQRVRAFYGDLGTPPPMLVCPPGTFGEAGLQGCRMVETMGCIVWSSEGLRQYESYVAEAMPAAQGVSSEYPAQQEPLRVDSEAE